jgi:DNA-binding transcriptional LysR family regulator
VEPAIICLCGYFYREDLTSRQCRLWFALTKPEVLEFAAMDRLTAMEIFSRVVSEGSFSGAARVLNMSKSAVSKYISDLEERLGARLLNRTTRRLSLTDVGKAYHERCLRVLSDIAEMEAAVSYKTQQVGGLLKIAAPVTFSVKHLGAPLSEFLKTYSDINVELNLNDRRVDIVDEGYDVAIRISRRLSDSSLIAAKLAGVRAITAASPQYLEEYGTPEHPRDLVNHNCLRYSNLGPISEWEFTSSDGEATSIHAKGSIAANNGEVLREAALDGIGIISGPSFLSGESIREGKLVQILSDFHQEDFSVFAVYPHNRHLSAKVRRLVDFLKDYWGNDPYWNEF